MGGSSVYHTINKLPLFCKRTPGRIRIRSVAETLPLSQNRAPLGSKKGRLFACPFSHYVRDMLHNLLHPPIWILHLPVLDPHDGIIEFLGQRAYFSVVDRVGLAPVGKLSNG